MGSRTPIGLICLDWLLIKADHAWLQMHVEAIFGLYGLLEAKLTHCSITARHDAPTMKQQMIHR